MNVKVAGKYLNFRHFAGVINSFIFNKLGLNLTATLIYVVVAQIFLQFANIHPNATPIWPLSGMSIGFLVLCGIRNWPTIFVGALTANLITNITIHSEYSLLINGMVASGIAFSNTLEALLGAWFITQFTNGKNCLDRSYDIFLFVVFVVFFPPMFSAGGGVLSLVGVGLVPWDQFGRVMLTWYTANAFGVLLFTPCFFTLSRPFKMHWCVLNVLELLCLFSLLIVIGQTISGIYFSNLLEGWPKSYMVIPLLLWIGFRFNYHGILAAILALSAIAMVGTMRGYEAFPAETPDLALLHLQLFLGVVTIMSFSVVALLTELEHFNQRLEELVDIRTQGINELLEQKQDLMAVIAHDLQSPIMGLQNILQLRHSPQYHITSKNWEAVLAQMEETCTNMHQLINQGLTRMETDYLSENIKYRREDINQLLKRYIQPHIYSANKKKIEIIDKISDDPIWLFTDVECIRRIVDNLLSNAIKYSPSRSSISIHSFLDDKYICFTVSDQGFGISKKELSSLFVKFKRLRHGPAYPDSFGIGLFSVQKLVSLLKGEVQCKSVEGKGSEFIVKLPLNMDSEV